jgi:hypothetical protein
MAKLLPGLAVVALLAQGALVWVVYRAFTDVPGPDAIDAVRWGFAMIGLSLGAGLVPLIGGLVVRHRAVLPIVVGLVAVGLGTFEGIFLLFIYVIGKGHSQ